jgi:hypothetical protein
MMALNFDEAAVLPENANQFFNDRDWIFALRNGTYQRAFFIAGEGNEAFGEFGQFVPARRCFSLFASQMGAREQSAKVLVTAAGLDQNWKDSLIFHGQFSADD